MQIKETVGKAFRFIIKSYTPVFIGVIGFFMVSTLLAAVMFANSETSTIHQRIALKEQEIAETERIAREKYERELAEYEERIKNQPCVSGLFKATLYDESFCGFAPKIPFPPSGLKFELANLNKIAEKSWFNLFLEKIFTDGHQYSLLSPFGFLLAFIISIPILKSLYLLIKNIPKMAGLAISQMNRIRENFQRMNSFQRYLLIVVSLGLMVYLLK